MSNERYYAASELAGLDGMPGTKQGVIYRANREKWPFRKRAGKGGGREYPESALPAATRNALIRGFGKQVERQLAADAMQCRDLLKTAEVLSDLARHLTAAAESLSRIAASKRDDSHE